VNSPARKYLRKVLDNVLELVGVTTLKDSLLCSKQHGIVCMTSIVASLVVLWVSVFVGVVKAQTPDPSPPDVPQPGVRPPLSPFPRFQDWSFLRDASLRVDPNDRLKFIPLNGSETNYLTFGLENR
jgi:hypothetical protein